MKVIKSKSASNPALKKMIEVMDDKAKNAGNVGLNRKIKRGLQGKSKSKNGSKTIVMCPLNWFQAFMLDRIMKKLTGDPNACLEKYEIKFTPMNKLKQSFQHEVSRHRAQKAKTFDGAKS